jgi:hypothetical protein
MWQRFAAGEAVIYAGVGLRIDPDGALECSVLSACPLAEVGPDSARADFSRADEVLARLSKHPAFSAMTRGRELRMVLCYERGHGAVPLCTRTDAGFFWSTALHTRDERRTRARANAVA